MGTAHLLALRSQKMKGWFSKETTDALQFHPRHFHDFLMDTVGFVDFKKHALNVKDRELVLYFKAGPIDSVLPADSASKDATAAVDASAAAAVDDDDAEAKADANADGNGKKKKKKDAGKRRRVE